MGLKADKTLLARFEQGIQPQSLGLSPIPAVTLGYGEISLIFKLDKDTTTAHKRLPLFSDLAAAEDYVRHYRNYCRLLADAGLNLPEDTTTIVQLPERPTVLYISQKQFPDESFGHRQIHSLPDNKIEEMIRCIIHEIDKIWQFNRKYLPGRELAIDGQVSNWIWQPEGTRPRLVYVDTSTPLYRQEGHIQLDPELFLKSAPPFLRWIIRWLFLKDVLNRYFDERLVYMDLAANLYKEQRPDLIPKTLAIINSHLSPHLKPLAAEEVKKYYREDKTIWVVFLAFRRLDRWIKTKLLRQRYEFILPGKIKR